jgi:protein SCO1
MASSPHSSPRRRLRSIIALAGTSGVLVAVAAGLVAPAHAAAPKDDAPSASRADPGDEILAPPPTFQANDVTVDERLGAQLPLDATFRTQDGALVTLGEALRGGLPAILTFNYSDCPMLCNLQLNGLVAALPAVGTLGRSPDPGKSDAMFRVGAQFRIVTIDLEPNEALDRARAMRQRYLDRLPEDQRAIAQAGWTFLVAASPGDATAIRRVADAVGFRYKYIEDRAEWAHPAALILLSASGVVTRYVYGIEHDPQVLRESIYKAGLAEPASAVGFLLRCYHYDPSARNHARSGVTALRVGAAGFVVLLFSAIGAMHLKRRGKRPPSGAAKGVT